MMQPVVMLRRLKLDVIMGSREQSQPTIKRHRRKKNRSKLCDRRKYDYRKGFSAQPGSFRGWPSDADEFVGFQEYEQTLSTARLQQAQMDDEDLVTFPETRVTSISADNEATFTFTVVPIVRKHPRVLSLCDGIGTGLLALHELGIFPEVYFSCEIDMDAIKIQRARFPNQIVALGCMKRLRSEEFLSSLGEVNLLLAGLPCEQFSLVNASRSEWNDPQSTAFLTFDLIQIRNFLAKRMHEQGLPFLWLSEQTAHMARDAKQRLTTEMGCEPVSLCASSWCPMKRKRLFFSNVPGLKQLADEVRGKTCKTRLQQYLGPFRQANVAFAKTMTTNRANEGQPVSEAGSPSKLHVTESEILMGFPENFTACCDLSVQRRRDLLARAWSVPVIKHILFPLREVFLSSD